MTAKERLDQVELEIVGTMEKILEVEKLTGEEEMVLYNSLDMQVIKTLGALFGVSLEINNGRITAALRPL